MDEYLINLGKARGVLEFQPSSPDLEAHTRGAYVRYAEKWAVDPTRWDLAPRSMQRFVEAGVRRAALEKLQVAAQDLEIALAGKDGAAMQLASQDIDDCLSTLKQVRPARRGRRKSAQLSDLSSPLLNPANHHTRHATIEG